MKMRHGFVSNSSTAFVIVLQRKPESPEELCKWLFGEKKVVVVEDCESQEFSTFTLAVEVFEILQEKQPLPRNEVVFEATRGPVIDEQHNEDYEAIHEHYSVTKDGDLPDWIKMDKEYDKISVGLAEDLLENNPDGLFFVLEYADDGENLERALAWGCAFENIDHIAVSLK